MKIKITSPCLENWDKMKADKTTRFCDSCNKNVMDFTLMNKNEIISLMLQNRNNHICGRMSDGLMEFSSEELMQVIDKELAKNTRTNYGFYLMLLGTLTMMSCNNGDSKLPAANSALPHTNYRTEAINNIPKPEPEEKASHVVNHHNKICNHKDDEDKGMRAFKGNLSTDIPMGDAEIKQPNDDPNFVYNNVEELPMFKGGTTNFQKFIDKNLLYPKWERENKIEGRVFIQFVVEKDGTITQPVIVREPKEAKTLGKEALRLIHLMPKWKPALQNGKAVRCSYVLPILFTLPK